MAAGKDSCIHIHARHDDTSITVHASPPHTHCQTDPTSADEQQLREHDALSWQMPSASVLQTQQLHNPDHVPCSPQHLQRLSDACAPSWLINLNIASEGEALDSSPATSGGSQAVSSAEPGASPYRRWMLADASRALQFERAVQTVLARAGPGATCIVSGAAASLAVVAAACSNVDQVVCLQVQQLPYLTLASIFPLPLRPPHPTLLAH